MKNKIHYSKNSAVHEAVEAVLLHIHHLALTVVHSSVTGTCLLFHITNLDISSFSLVVLIINDAHISCQSYLTLKMTITDTYMKAQGFKERVA